MGGTWSDFWDAKEAPIEDSNEKSLGTYDPRYMHMSKPDIPRVTLRQLLVKRDLKTSEDKYAQSIDEAVALLYTSLLSHGYAVIAIDELMLAEDLVTSLTNLDKKIR